MVDLMLGDARRPPAQHQVDRPAVLVERLDPHGAVPGNEPGKPGHTEAPLIKAGSAVLVDWQQHGVDEHHKREF
jgi:hypothetical protein